DCWQLPNSYISAFSKLFYRCTVYTDRAIPGSNFNPPNPSMSATAPLGSVMATINLTWSDGSPFTGTLPFAQPYSNDNGIFAISGNNLIVNPSGPGLSADDNTVQNVTIVAT